MNCGSEIGDMVATEVVAATAIAATAIAAAATSITETTTSSCNLKGSQLSTRLCTGGHTVSCDAVVLHLPEHLKYREQTNNQAYCRFVQCMVHIHGKL